MKQRAIEKHMYSITKFDWLTVRVGGISAVLLFRILNRPFRKVIYENKLSNPLQPNEMLVLAANHQKRLDPPAIFSAVSLKDLYLYSPVKFLTWRRYYHSPVKPILYLTGCYPTHGKHIHGVSGSVFLAKKGYTVFVFPEGKRTSRELSTPRDGIAHILNALPEARFLLVHIEWLPRGAWYRRSTLRVVFADAPESLDKQDPKAIMQAIYAL